MSEPRWDVPSSWAWSSAGGIARIVGGGTPSSKNEDSFAPHGIPWITPADLTGYEDAYIARGRRDLSDTGYRTSGAQLLPAGTVLFSSRAPIGYCAIAQNEISTNQGFKSLVLEGGILPEFIRYYLIASKAYAETLATGTTFLELSGARVAELSIPVAPLPEQRRIVAKLDALLAGVARARKELDRVPILIAHHKQALLAAAFSGELTQEWRAKNTTASAAGFVAERQKQIHALANEPGRGRDEKSALLSTDADLLSHLEAIANEQPIPKQWTWAGIGQVFGTYVGATPSRKEPRYWDGTINWVSSGEVAFCRISNTSERLTEEGLNNASTRIHPPGTVLLGMIGEGKTRGQAAILDIPACNNQNCAAIRVSDAGYPPEYVYWYLHLAYQTTRNAGSGNNQPALNKDRVQRLPIPLAPVEEALEIARIIAAAFSWFDTVADEHAHAAKLLPKLEQTILAKAFRGELVPQVATDEPASVLLERIRVERACLAASRAQGART